MPLDVPLTSFARAHEATSKIRAGLPEPLHTPHIAIVCGSGLGNLQYSLLPSPAPKVEFPYADLPHFPTSTAFTKAIVTNAAGGLNQEYSVGDIVLLHDHLNLAGLVGIHPLRGPNEEEFGTRFPPLSDAYELGLRRRAHVAWREIGPVVGKKRLHEGVYAFVGGPTYETRAECRMLRMLGADVVGMSTVPEVITARHCGIKVMALSLVTNVSVLEAGPTGNDPSLAALSEQELQEYLSRGMANHEEVLEAGKEAAQVMQALIESIVEHIDAP